MKLKIMKITPSITYGADEEFKMHYLSIICNEGFHHRRFRTFKNVDDEKVRLEMSKLEIPIISSAVLKTIMAFFYKKDEVYYVVELRDTTLKIRQYTPIYTVESDHFNDLCTLLNIKPEKSINTFSITFTSYNINGNYMSCNTKQLNGSKLDDILENYGKVVNQYINQIRNIKKIKKNGKLIILNGKPGTGKTHLLRALLREWHKNVSAYYITDPENLLKTPEYLNQILSTLSENEKAIIIMEDCDFFISKQSKTEYTQSASRLLNTLDGILGQGMDFIFILTANEDIKNIHEAFSRKGRCLANIPFEGLTHEEAKIWCEKHGVNIDDVNSSSGSLGINKSSNSYFTLADLYDIATKNICDLDSNDTDIATD
jgi:hypothetical protein